MFRPRTLLLWAVAAIVAAMIVPSAAALSTVGGASAALSPTAVAPAALDGSALTAPSTSTHSAASAAPANVESQVLSGIKNANIPSKDVFLPNFNARTSVENGMVQPLYNVSPAPMGIGDFGIQNVNGQNVGTISYTSSVKASVTINSVDPLYVTSSAPDEFTMQLNTVLTNVNLFGNYSYDFWIQNVPIYAESSQTLSFEDNIWNFSSPSFYFSSNSIYAHGPGGVVAAPELYFAQGPSFHMPTPFTVTVYNNATVQDGRSTVYFNYTVVPSDGIAFSGSYDYAEFNSSTASPIAPPTYQINGEQLNPTDFLLNDAEIMLGGPGGGSTTTLFHIQAKMGLWTEPNGSSSYVTVPSAFDFGTDTGETSEGISEYATTGANPIAVLNAGPDDLYGLWGMVGAHQGEETITLNLHPTNAFVFVSPGPKFNSSTAAWSPTSVSGPTEIHLAPGTYSFRYVLSEYKPKSASYSSSGTWSVTLASDPGLGDYTPLWAESNSQLAAISEPGGAGTVSNPYVLFNGPANIDPLFGEVNDYDFPVFPGIYLIDTTAYVTAANLPSFNVNYLPIFNYAGRLSANGLPLSDQLNIELYHASHVSIVDSSQLSGWFFTDTSFGEPATIYLWNSSYNLIAGNTFYVESNGITLSGGTHNVIWGNVFYSENAVAADPSAILNYGITPSIWAFESGDLIFNNAFLTPLTAIEFPENFYTGAPQLNIEKWNVPVQSSSDIYWMNGFPLSGSILGLAWEGGNYWWNYGTPSDPYGVLPYNDGGYIVLGGDNHPLIAYSIYAVTFSETGLKTGTAWSVTIDGYSQTSTASTITFWEPSGTYAYTVSPVAGHTVTPASGAFTVVSSSQVVHIHFHKK